MDIGAIVRPYDPASKDLMCFQDETTPFDVCLAMITGFDGPDAYLELIRVCDQHMGTGHHWETVRQSHRGQSRVHFRYCADYCWQVGTIGNATIREA